MTLLPKTVNIPLSSQPCQRILKTDTRPVCLQAGRSRCSVPTYCGGYRQENNKFGKLKSMNRVVSHTCIKAFADCQRSLPRPAEPNWPALRPSSQANASRGSWCCSLSLSNNSRAPVCLQKVFFLSFFRLPLQNPPCRGNSFWGLAKCWLKYYILTWSENEGQDSEFKAEEWKILLDKQTVLKKAARGFEANESFWFLGKSCTLFDSTLSLNNPIF